MVALRDGKSYDPTAEASGGSSRRRSTATATVSSAQRTVQTRRSARLAQASTDPTDADEDNVPFQTPQAPPAATPARNKRQRPQQLTVVAEPAAGAATGAEAEQDSDDLDTCDIGTTDQGMQLQEAADMELPADEPSPSAMHANKKPRIPTCRTPTPSKAAVAAAKQRREALSVSIAAAVMVLVAAVAAGVLLPQLAPHREQFKASLQQTAAYTNAVYLQPFKHRALDSMDTASARLAAASAAAQQQVQTLLLQAHVRWPSLIPLQLLQQHKGQPAGSPGAWSAGSLSSILPAGAQWVELAEDIADKLGAPAAQRNHKAPALVLACGSADDCNEAAAALSVLPPKDEACALTIDSSKLQAGDAAQPAAALQALLAPFLKRCPAGLVILKGMEALPVGAVPALHNALSELGGFQHDGTVDGSKAAYALLLQLPPARVAAAAAASDSTAAGAAIKESFFELLNAALATDVSDEDAAHLGVLQRAISTLHRRIEFAAPVRLGPSSEAALEELESAATAADNRIADNAVGGGDDAEVDDAEYEPVGV